MPTIEEQNRIDIGALNTVINGLINNAKKTSDNVQQVAIESDSKIRVLDSSGIVKWINISQIIGEVFNLWKTIEGSFVEKAIGNVDLNTLEVNDNVYFKKITNNSDPLTLIGHTYNGGDKQLRTSYTQNQVIDI